MGRIAAIAQREIGGLFYSPIGYMVIALYLEFMGFLFARFVFIPGRPADMRQMFELSYIAQIFLVPIMTMGFFSDEYSSGRIEMLRTSPITEFDIVMGKFFGAMGFYLALVASTLVYVLLLAIYGHPNYGAVGAGYFGMVLMGTFCISIGLFFSALTKSQQVAVLCGITLLANSGFYAKSAADFIDERMTANFWLYASKTLHYLSFGDHMAGFSRGIVETSHIFFFLGGAFLFLFATYIVLESRKWR